MPFCLLVVAEDEARVPLAEGARFAVGDGGGGPLNVARFRRFGMLQMSRRELRGPVGIRIEGKTRGPRIDFAGVDVPSLFVRLAAVETAERKAEDATLRADRQYAAGDVRRVLHVMAERRLRDFRRGRAMRIRDRTERRIAEGRRVDVADRVIGQRMRILGGELHEEVMRMLRVDDRTTVDRLAGLEQLWIFLADRQRLETEH